MRASRVLHVTASARRRGAEVFARDLSDAMAGAGRRSEVVALEAGSVGADLGVPVIGRRARSLTTLRSLRELLTHVDVAVAHGSTTLWAVAAAAATTRTPFVYRSIGDPRYWRSTRIRQRAVLQLLRRADRVVALWDGAAEALISHGVDPARIDVIPNGVPLGRFPLVDERRRIVARRRIEIDSDTPVAVYIGSLSHEKGVDVGIRSLRHAPRWSLLIAGDGPLRSQLQALAEVEAPGRVTFMGPVERPADVYACADAVILPSRTEGMAAVLIEAACSGVPVVATDVGAVREVVVDGLTGFIVPTEDFVSMGHALAKAEHCAVNGVAARERCTDFDILVVASRWLVVVDEAVHG